MASEFNLLEEPWVRVMRPDCVVEEVSLRDALSHAHEYVDLAGEMPTQDAAMLRMMLALLFAVFARQDAEGNPSPIDSTKKAIERWRSLWTLGRFPEKPIEDYFTKWHDRFYLFDDEHPFYQIPAKAWRKVTDDKKGTELVGTSGDVSKLNGELLESKNKARLFKTFSGNAPLSLAQASRWLLALMANDDTAAKATKDTLAKDEKHPSPGVGWLGRLGYIQAQGKTLFETLLLNLTFLKDGHEVWTWEPPDGAEKDFPWLYLPAWELDEPRDGERSPCFLRNHQDGIINEKDPEWNTDALVKKDRKPINPMALFTIQSRRLMLERVSDSRDGKSAVAGYVLLGGDFFQKENAFVEQMTLWRNTNAKKKNEAPCFVPKQHDPDKQFWREFPAAFIQQEGEHVPGLLGWINKLYRESGCFRDRPLVQFRVCSLVYGDKYFFVADAFRDALSFHAALLAESGLRTRSMVKEEIGLCEEAAQKVDWLARNLAEAAGDKNGGNAGAKRDFYFRIDIPFRQWLEELDPEGDVDGAIDAWREKARTIALALGKELAHAAGPTAFVGRVVKGKHLSTAEALRIFCGSIHKLYPTMKGE